jgi:hypothetical protein
MTETTISKEYIKENAKRLAALVLLRERICSRDGYKLGLHLKGINRDFQQGIEIATLYTEDHEQGGMIWRGEDGKPEYQRGDSEMTELLNALFNDEMLFDAVKSAQTDYDGRISWRIDTCTRGFDFDMMQDAYYTEQTIKLNPSTLRVSISKPRHYSRSVLVALNID